MRPPICNICGKRFDEDGDLVTFSPSKKDREVLQKLQQDRYVGHPPNKEWFCKKHVTRAKELTEYTLEEAMNKY